MRKLFEAADRYVETSDWKIIAVLKFCLISLGVILGMEVKEKSRTRLLTYSFLVKAKRAGRLKALNI